MFKSVRAGRYVEYVRFFRGRLLTLTVEEIEKWLEEMDKQANSIRKEALTLAWYMRGGLEYTDALQLSYSERTLINEIISANLETTKKSGLPFF